VWSPDGQFLVFDSTQTGSLRIHIKSTDGTGEESVLVNSGEQLVPQSWSSDGRFFLYRDTNARTGQDLFILPMGSHGKPSGASRPWVTDPFNQSAARFSPDGRWVAYHSDQSGRAEIYIRPFSAEEPAATSNSGGIIQVSNGGGIYPSWRKDGSELYYLAPDARLMAVPLKSNGGHLEASEPVPLFQTHVLQGGTMNNQGRQYDVAPDGRFLIVNAVDDAVTPITLIQNWNPLPVPALR
jgi:eukaryotic-like serine/threonine-protein kinase